MKAVGVKVRQPAPLSSQVARTHFGTTPDDNSPLSRLQHPREVVRQFTPNWFTATMGTGILALALNQFPLDLAWLKFTAQILWFINIGLFALCIVLYCARWLFFFDGARRIFQHSVMCMFFGAIPMGLATIINGFLVFGIPRWGSSALEIAHVLWWLDAAMAFACAWLVPYLMFTRQDHSLQSMTAVWLLPIVAAEVTAASGGLLLGHLPAGARSKPLAVLELCPLGNISAPRLWHFDHSFSTDGSAQTAEA